MTRSISPSRDSDTATPIEVATNTPGTAINVGSAPFGIAITPDGRTAYVSNGTSGTVTPIEVATNTPGTAINVGSEPGWIAITPAPACTTAEGTGTYKRRGEKGRFTVRDHLSTALTGTQMLSVNTESGEARFGLTKLSSAKCEARAGGGFKFSGEGPSRYYRKNGYNISFSITVKGRKASFSAKLSNGSIVVNEEENALTKSSEVIH